ncbi:MAG TPA: ABC-type transport auxiliary lipoprotein family protein [Steroidobacteraceae bacterium]|nr:ABC-type transport auxiliary lipoprotein family protein [Steroidobacteraceae bacterium]
MSRLAQLMAIVVLALTGCGGSFFQTKAAPPALYLLSARAVPAGAAAVTPLPADLAVLKPRVRAGLETDRIAALYPDRRLEYFADARWSGPLDEVIQQLAVQQFRASARFRDVSSDASVFAGDYWLEIEVTNFQAEYSAAAAAPPMVHVHLLGRVGTSAGRHMLAALEADAKEVASDNHLSAIVDAYNRAADKALAEIVAGTVQALNAR